ALALTNSVIIRSAEAFNSNAATTLSNEITCSRAAFSTFSSTLLAGYSSADESSGRFEEIRFSNSSSKAPLLWSGSHLQDLYLFPKACQPLQPENFALTFTS